MAAYWCFKVEREAGRSVGAMEIWYRFPKFVLGFIGVSIVFSIIYAQMGSDVGYAMIDNGVIKGLTKISQQEIPAHPMRVAGNSFILGNSKALLMRKRHTRSLKLPTLPKAN